VWQTLEKAAVQFCTLSGACQPAARLGNASYRAGGRRSRHVKVEWTQARRNDAEMVGVPDQAFLERGTHKREL
jgi:hypothetical protein